MSLFNSKKSENIVPSASETDKAYHKSKLDTVKKVAFGVGAVIGCVLWGVVEVTNALNLNDQSDDNDYENDYDDDFGDDD